MIMTELKDRLQVADKEKWNLTDIYHTIEDWESDFHKIEVLTNELHKFNGNIHDGNSLLAYLTKSEEISSIISLMFAYARLQLILIHAILTLNPLSIKYHNYT